MILWLRKPLSLAGLVRCYFFAHFRRLFRLLVTAFLLTPCGQKSATICKCP